MTYQNITIKTRTNGFFLDTNAWITNMESTNQNSIEMKIPVQYYYANKNEVGQKEQNNEYFNIYLFPFIIENNHYTVQNLLLTFSFADAT